MQSSADSEKQEVSETPLKRAKVEKPESKNESQTKEAEITKVDSSEDERAAQTKGAELVKGELSEPPSKKAKVQYGIGKWFKPEAKDYKPVL